MEVSIRILACGVTSRVDVGLYLDGIAAEVVFCDRLSLLCATLPLILASGVLPIWLCARGCGVFTTGTTTADPDVNLELFLFVQLVLSRVGSPVYNFCLCTSYLRVAAFCFHVHSWIYL